MVEAVDFLKLRCTRYQRGGGHIVVLLFSFDWALVVVVVLDLLLGSGAGFKMHGLQYLYSWPTSSSPDISRHIR